MKLPIHHDNFRHDLLVELLKRSMKEDLYYLIMIVLR